MTVTEPEKKSFKQCSTGGKSKEIIDLLNMLYSYLIGDLTLSSKKDWCNCDKNKKGSIFVLI